MNTHRVVLALAIASVTGIPASGQSWSQKSPLNNPGGLMTAGSAYDAANGQVVLFGGFSLADGFVNRTYTWDGNNWTRKTPANSPSSRQFPAMAYDAATRNVILFGGVDGNGPVNDTWVWNGSTWTQKAPANSPDPRASVMVYDAARAQVVLFSGNLNLADTWVWDGNTWTQKSPQNSPSARYGHMMAYDAARQQVVLFGGFGPFNANAETWTWDGTNWTQQTPRHKPAARVYGGMVYDAVSSQVLLFGGRPEPGNPFNDTWAWNGFDWVPPTPAVSPSQRWAPAMAFDARRHQVMMFGGMGLSLAGPVLPSDTWIWTTNVEASAGNPQSVPTGQVFAPLEVTVVDDTGHYQNGVQVTFSGPPAFVSIQGNSSPKTDTTGRTTARPVATSRAGSYTVTASPSTGGSTTFVLSNVNTAAALGPCQVTTAADDDSPGSLRYQAAACGRGGTITFAPGVTTVSLAHGQDIQLTQDLTIDGGAGVTIDAGYQSRIFFVKGGSVTLQNLTLQNGLAKGGNGGNAAQGGGGAAGMGGAVFVNGGTLITSNVTFSNNLAQGGSGGSGLLGGDVLFGGGGGIGNDSFGWNDDPVLFTHGGGGGDLLGSGGFSGGPGSHDGGPGAGSALNGTPGFGGGGSVGQNGSVGSFFGGGGGALGRVGTFGGGGDTIYGGGAGLGGAIFVRSGALLMQQTSFLSNSAKGGLPGGGAAKSGEGKGGALFVNAGALAASFSPRPVYSLNQAGDANARTSCASVVDPIAQDTNDQCGTVWSASLQPDRGSDQSAQVNTPFANPLVATITAGGKPMPGVRVSFLGPDSGASINPVLQSAITDGTGAASVAVSANGVAGVQYRVAMQIAGIPSVVGFVLTNTPPPDLTITSTHAGNFFLGQVGATYTISVTNSGAGATNGSTVTVFDNLPFGMIATDIAGTGWSCAFQSPTCTRSDVLSPGGSYPPITVTVSVFRNAKSSVTNSATVSGGGDPVSSNNVAFDPTTIDGGPDLQVTMMPAGGFHPGDPADKYTIAVSNVGGAATDGAIRLTVNLGPILSPTAFTAPSGWTCTLSPLACSTSRALAVNSSAPFVLTVSVSNTAASGISNSRATVTGGGDITLQNNTATDMTIVQ